MKQIKTVEQIYKLALKGRCVVVKYTTDRRIPAAFLINYQAHYLVNLLRAGKIYEYGKKKIQKAK